MKIVLYNFLPIVMALGDKITQSGNSFYSEGKSILLAVVFIGAIVALIAVPLVGGDKALKGFGIFALAIAVYAWLPDIITFIKNIVGW